jgi:putative nucleotidyltransferase with HDIG domain
MTPAACFLGSFGRALATMALYRGGHPALEHAIESAWQDLEALLAVAPRAAFTFLGETVLLGDDPLPDRRGWEWSERLSAAGIQRVEFAAPFARAEFDGFLSDVFARLVRHQPGRVSAPSTGPQGVRYGSVGLRVASGMVTSEGPMPTATLAFSLHEEVETARWLHEEVRSRHPIPLLEAETIVRSLSVAMHAESQMVLPLVQLKEFDQYSTTHSLNVSVLAMGLAERVGLGDRDVRAYGVAGVLHDIGKTLIPLDILNKPGRYTDAERETINRHPADGARLILRADESLDLAAVVAYEHHVMINGGGYPPLRAGRACHEASRLVHVCDVFDALRTHRPYRDAWSLEKALEYLRERAGLEFDPQFVQVFVAMMVECDSCQAAVTGDGDAFEADRAADQPA